MICCCKLVGFKMQSIPDEFCFKVIMFFLHRLTIMKWPSSGVLQKRSNKAMSIFL